MKRIVVLMLLFGIGAWVGAQTVADYMAAGDKAFNSFDNPGSLKQYQMAWQKDSTNCETLWKISRSHINIGETADKDMQKAQYYAGEKFARLAVRRCPDNADAHLSLAIAVGRVALMEGGKKKVELSKEVKAEAEKTLELDPNKDIAHHVLARWHREVTHLSGILKMFAKILYGGLPPASDELALSHFKKALELNPTYINHHLEMGITYEYLEQWEAARQEYKKVAELAIGVFNDQDHKKEAADRLAKILNKK
jgi:tetratricopeptide (TPR) repeat protein